MTFWERFHRDILFEKYRKKYIDVSHPTAVRNERMMLIVNERIWFLTKELIIQKDSYKEVPNLTLGGFRI